MFLPQLEPVQVRLAAGSQEEDCGCVRKLPLLLYAWKNAHQLIVRLIAIVNHMKSWWAVNFGSGQMLCVPTNPLFTIFKKEYDRPVIPSSNSLCRVKWSTRRLLWLFAELTLPPPLSINWLRRESWIQSTWNPSEIWPPAGMGGRGLFPRFVIPDRRQVALTNMLMTRWLNRGKTQTVWEPRRFHFNPSAFECGF